VAVDVGVFDDEVAARRHDSRVFPQLGEHVVAVVVGVEYDQHGLISRGLLMDPREHRGVHR
jgi:hypothetical protein